MRCFLTINNLSFVLGTIRSNYLNLWNREWLTFFAGVSALICEAILLIEGFHNSGMSSL